MIKKKKRLLWILCPSLFLYFLPSLLSTKPGKAALLSIINLPNSGFVSIETLSLKWTGPQKIEKITYQTKDLDFKCDAINSSMSLTTLISKPYSIKELELINPNIKITPAKISFLRKSPNVQTASLNPAAVFSTYMQKNPLPFVGKLTICNGTFKTLDSTFTAINCCIDIHKNLDLVSVSFETKALYGKEEGVLSLHGVLENSPVLKLSIKGKSSHLPTAGIDQLLSLTNPEYSDLCQEMIGPFLDMTCIANSQDNVCKLEVLIQALKLQTDIKLTTQGSVASLIEPAFIQMHLPISRLNLPIEIPLQKNDTPISLRIEKLSFPLKEQGPLLKEASFNVKATIPSVALGNNLSAKIETTIFSTNLSEKVENTLLVTLNSPKKSSLIEIETLSLEPFSLMPQISSSCLFKKIPTLLAGEAISNALGEWIDFSLYIEGTKEHIKGSFEGKTPLLALSKINFSIEDKALTLQDSALATYTFQSNSKATLLLNQLKMSDFTNKETLQLESAIQFDPISFSQFKEEAFTLKLKIDSFDRISLSGENASFLLESAWSFKEKENSLALTKPLLLEYKANKENILSLFPFFKDLGLSNNPEIYFTAQPTSFFLQDPLKNLEVRSQIKVPNLNLKNASVSNCKLDLIFSQKTNSLQFTSEAEGLFADIRGTIYCKGVAEKPLSFPDALISSANIKLDNFPIELFEQFAPQEFEPSILLGKTITGVIELEQKEQKESLSLKIHTPFLFIEGSFKLKEDVLSLMKPLQLEYRLTPNTFQNISESLTLVKESILKGSITELHIPNISTKINPENSFIKAQVETPQLVFKNSNSQKALGIHNLSCSIEKGQKEKKIVCQAKAQTTPAGTLLLNSEIEEIFSEDGSLNISNAKITMDLTAKQIPSLALDVAFSSSEEFFIPLIGDSFSMDAKVSLQNFTGLCSLQLSSPQFSFDMNGVIVSGIFRLQENAIAKIQLTPEMSRLFLKGEDSSIRSLSAPNPLTIEVSARKFSIPLNPFSVSQIQAPLIQIKPGKIYCESAGSLNKILKLLKSKKTKAKEIEVWFAPIELHIDQGIIEVDRSEILIDNQHDIAFWGPINLPNNSINMTLGISAKTLQDSLGIKGLPKDYMLKFPIKGSLNNIELGTLSATTKIAALVLWSSKALEKLGPLGGALNQIIPPPGGEGKTPPQKHPLPWER